MTRFGDVNYRDVPGRGDMPGRVVGDPQHAEDQPEDDGFDRFDRLVDTDPLALRDLARRLDRENERLRSALLSLQQWDMLSLTSKGHGAATEDAPWARALIADALGDVR